jgi:hypothetical protein
MLTICCHISDDINEDNVRQVQDTEDDDEHYDETYDELADLIESRMNLRSVSFSY